MSGSPGQNTGVGSLSLLQGFSQPMGQTQISRITDRFFISWATSKALEYGVVTYPFSSRSSWSRNRTRVSCLAGGFFTNWAIRGALKVKVAQSCPTLCNPVDYAVHGILQARILEWVAFPFFRGSSQTRDWTQVSHIAGGVFTSWTTREALTF